MHISVYNACSACTPQLAPAISSLSFSISLPPSICSPRKGGGGRAAIYVVPLLEGASPSEAVLKRGTGYLTCPLISDGGWCSFGAWPSSSSCLAFLAHFPARLLKLAFLPVAAAASASPTSCGRRSDLTWCDSIGFLCSFSSWGSLRPACVPRACSRVNNAR